MFVREGIKMNEKSEVLDRSQLANLYNEIKELISDIRLNYPGGPNAAFGVAFSIDTLENFNNFNRVMKNCQRLLQRLADNDQEANKELVAKINDAIEKISQYTKALETHVDTKISDASAIQTMHKHLRTEAGKSTSNVRSLKDITSKRITPPFSAEHKEIVKEAREKIEQQSAQKK